MRVEERIKQLGLELPEAPRPVAQYVPGIQSGNLVYTAGQVPFLNGELKYRGKVGRECSLEEGYDAARICFLNCLAVVKSLAGDLDRVKRVVKINGFVNCVPEFTDQPKVINGASELAVELFGEKGRHARAAVGSVSLPLDAPVELELIVELEKSEEGV